MVAGPRGPLRVMSLTRYQGVVARLILQVKVQGNFRALWWISCWVARHKALRGYLEDSEKVIACPSSLWGRMRGRFDIAATLAVSIGREHDLRVIRPTFRQFWRLKKRAMISKSVRQRSFRPVPRARKQASEGNGQMVIVDDVVTSGLTVGEVHLAMPCGGARVVTFSDAWREGMQHGTRAFADQFGLSKDDSHAKAVF